VNTSEKEILEKIGRFCAYRERCEFEVIEKLKEWEVSEFLSTKILAFLLEENFVNNSRFARIYATGKHRHNQWGKQKIYQGLREKKINANDIENALDQLDEAEYLTTLDFLIQKKNRKIKATNVYEQRQKIATFLMQKGYEGDLVWDTLKDKIK
jgi:regulatory protein